MTLSVILMLIVLSLAFSFFLFAKKLYDEEMERKAHKN